MPDLPTEPLRVVLWIEGRRVAVQDFVPDLRAAGYQVVKVASGKRALEWLNGNSAAVAVVFAASFGSSGCRIVRSLRRAAPQIPILLILGNDTLHNPQAQADEVLVLPFTKRKLINRVRRLAPLRRGPWFQVGKVWLDESNRIVRCLAKESRLTPRLTRLLRFFMEHPGEILSREQIFRAVWDTEYTNDVRSLQVHITWLRRAIEPDPRNPRFIQTLRTLGYRFNPEGQ